ncbi:trypsin-like peptidase domain-containing protein [Methylotenera versatilis]|uniref:trypsin-like peptidase domain-containing protein n=1 Tax=Methylotenera versatilis TaxID=1055487 RepID=UPI0006465183|nr:trypsin-like peptidase domain-containing protein [Methylotenera versatilis]
MRFLVLITAMLVATPSAFAFETAKMMDALWSVVMVRGYNATGGLAYGSGVVVGENKVLTNCHVLRATKQPWISRGEDTYPITSVKVDAWHDLCLVSAFSMPFKAVVIGKSTDLKRGQQVAAIGHSNGVPTPLTSSGNVKALFDSDNGKIIRSTAKFTMGASGSGLFDMQGHLVGINTFKTAGSGGSIHYALPIEWLEKLEKEPETTIFPVIGKALWEDDEDKKPFYLQAAVPESRQDWPKLANISAKWTQAEPKNSEAWYALGLANENLAKLDLAQQAYQQAVNLDKGHFDALVRLGAIAKNQGDTNTMHRIQVTLNDIDKDIGAEYSEMMGCDKEC